MGCFSSTGSRSTVLISDRLCTYNRNCKIPIKIRNKVGNVVGAESVSLQLSEPILVTSKQLTLKSEQLQISSCVIPGLDPRGEYKKKCQDNCFYLHDENGILCCLFDGHGGHGERVAEFCQEIIESLFSKQKKLLENPPDFIKLATEKCDKELSVNTKNIDSEYSGCTGVLIYINESTIYCGSVGDSRGIIATMTIPEVLPAPPANLGAEREILAKVKQKRKSFIDHQVNSVQLTRDQKPEDPEELQRILKAGGRVQRLSDNMGNKIGPYRVWKQNANSPGLAMSRSIGDMVAKDIGVISEPVCTTYNRQPGDLFIVIGSDGIWDAMDNEDVGTFVECYRGKCKAGVNSAPCGVDVSPANAGIAQIVCEEARMRWFTIVEEEDVMIDDISCIVLEINRNTGILLKHNKRPVPIEEVKDEVPEEESVGLKRAPTLKEISVRDPRRGSFVSDKIEGLA